MILEFGHTSTLRDAVDASVPGAATHDWEVSFRLQQKDKKRHKQKKTKRTSVPGAATHDWEVSFRLEQWTIVDTVGVLELWSIGLL